MRITAVKCILLSAPYAAPGDLERERHLRTGYRPAAIIKVETDEGLYGLGESYAGVYAPEVVRELVAQFERDLLGLDPMETLRLQDRLSLACRYWGRMGISQSALGGIEMALWDLKGKALNQPVYQLLGGKVHDELPIYASGGNPKPAAELETELRGYLKAGFPLVKIRIGMLSLEEIEAMVEFCRGVLGESTGLAVDAVQGLAKFPWEIKKVIRIAQTIERFNIRWIEEPAEVTDYAGFAEIRRRISIPVAGGESVTSLVEAESYLEADALDLFQIDATAIAGLEAFRQVAQLCERKFIPVAVHAWCSGVGIMGNYHAAFASKNCTVLEMPTPSNPLREELLVQPWQIRNGNLQVPTAPGLGVDLPKDFEQKYPYRPGSVYRILGT